MTPRQRILSVLNGQMPDRVPFTIKLPQPPMGVVERQLRNDGLAMCTDKMVYTTVRPKVEVFNESPSSNFVPSFRVRTAISSNSEPVYF